MTCWRSIGSRYDSSPCDRWTVTLRPAPPVGLRHPGVVGSGARAGAPQHSKTGVGFGGMGHGGLDEAFAGWIEAQQAAVATMRDADVPRTPADDAEGYRWVTRLASLAQDWFVEKADPLHPVLFIAQSEYRKLMVDNPDVQYRFSPLDDAAPLPAHRHPGRGRVRRAHVRHADRQGRGRRAHGHHHPDPPRRSSSSARTARST